MRFEDRQRLRAIYAFRCGYCGVTETEVGAELTIDHFQPRSRGGSDQLGNLVYACHACNEFKGDYWEPNAAERVLHPLSEGRDQHIAAGANGVLVGLTPTGRFHIERLRLNRPGLVLHRRETEALLETRQHIGAIEQELRDMRAIVEELLRRLPPNSGRGA